ncbi:MAG: hypothetical protein A2600_04740 [Candidatus Lambdaproteobacteria bacterium RIFOXYD1_FULL_56_27]|uniref:Uncharacterized protein n=1 Tax=Candidatus Lambdaproteobacteria bacterium RIFOXYD2_FULL_56_26 TaxID=1817773 RepID=A0A1F6H3W2_9PROT|nr:MAG: hypothetical protein A2426_13805 [Candidatus Lambdaproteobacteria bacterium RIFOXYC1_FULL_56_13]OGH05061.1 MAG: hypothetical protein A2557_08805 [Candidatus Lambdaproteobacteria bacterium RIFOXYD2_FULL_56_26]OGH09526.1 MAG: hypothetical protein A2600_04740 [Candidatus Lambdaproteobacteria bacterium RIFOXYD1_FULL_56_27]
MNLPTTLSSPPMRFWPLLVRAFGLYKANLLNFFLLGFLSYLPFWLLDLAADLDLSDPVELIHGFLLDILVCLALPTLLNHGRIYPFATLKIFQDYFASAVLVVLSQVFLLFVLMLFFSGLGLPFVMFALMPFVLVLFVGHFALVNGKPAIRELGQNLVDSFQLVKSSFSTVFFGYLNISLLMILPIMLFSLYYLGTHPQIEKLITQVEQESQLEQSGQNEALLGLVESLKIVVGETGYQTGRLALHLLFRPLKSLFLALLFAQLLERLNPKAHQRFFGLAEPLDPQEPLSSGLTPKE